MRVLERLTKRTANRRFYFTMLTTYAFFTVGAVLASSLVLLGYSRAFLRSEIERSDRYLLSQAQIRLDDALIQETNAFFIREFLNPTTSGAVADFFSGSDNPGPLYYYLANSLSATVYSSPFIRSIELYRLGDDTLVSSDAGVTFEASTRTNPATAFRYDAQLASAIGHEEPAHWVSPAENTGFPETLPTLTYARRIPLYGQRESARGYVMIHLDASAIAGAVSEIYSSQPTSFLLADSAGRVLVGDPVAPDSILPAAIHSALAGSSGFTVVSLLDGPAGLSWSRSQVNDWVYLTVTPMRLLHERLQVLRNLGAIVLTIAVVLSTIALVPLTLRIYAPLRRLVERARNELDEAQIAVSDIELIGGAMGALRKRVGDMSSQIEANRPLIEHKMISDIVYGNVREAALIERRLEYLGLAPSPRSWVLVLVDLEQSVIRELRYSPREYLIIEMTEFVVQFFSDAARCISYEPGRLVAIVDARATVNSAEATRLIGTVADQYGIASNLAWSSRVSDPSQIHRHFSSLRSVNSVSFLLGYGTAFDETTLARIDARDLEIDPRSLTEFDAIVKTDRLDDLRVHLEGLVHNAVERAARPESVRAVLSQVLSLVTHAYSEQGVDVSQVAQQIKIADPLHAESAADCVEEIVSIARALRSAMGDLPRHLNQGFLGTIVHYIRETVGRQTSLVSVADHFGISPGHLSRVFKQGMGSSFSEFVLETRLGRAAERLADPDCGTISELAHELGYENHSYFARLFRERYGLTPAQYRKSRITAVHAAALARSSRSPG